MSTTPRCRSCGEPLHRVVVDLGRQPLANAYPTEDILVAGTERSYPLVVRLCESCFLMQVDDVVTRDEIFAEYSYFSSYSRTWLEHARRFARTASRALGLGPDDLVIEIASNDGYLLREFVELGIPVLGIEPAANVAAMAIEEGIPTEVAFFGSEKAHEIAVAGRRGNLVVANNVMAHVPELNDFVAGLAEILMPDGVLTVEVQHLRRLIEQTAFDTIYHEHYSYFSALAAKPLFERHGLRIVDVEALTTHGGSLRFWVTPNASDRFVHPRVDAMVLSERAAGLDTFEVFAGFSRQVDRSRQTLREFLDTSRRDGQRIAAYGAAAKGNTLLNSCGATTDDVEYVVDRNPYKQGRFLPGSHLPIMAPQHVFSTRPDFLLILPWNLEQEIRSQMHSIASWGGRFVVPVPTTSIRP